MDHIWTNINIYEKNHRTGIRLRFNKDIDGDIRRACKEFAKLWR